MSFFCNLISFAIIARMLCGNHLYFFNLFLEIISCI